MERRATEYVTSLPSPRPTGELITQADIAALPPVVRRYFDYSGVVGKPKIQSFSFTMRGRIQMSPGGRWSNLVARQFNQVAEPARIYFIQAKGFPLSGIDSYMHGAGRMHIKILNLFTVADSRGPEMDQSGLVTFLNDLVVCPLGYFSVPVEWEQVADDQATVTLTHRGITASGRITFGEDGRILNWESDDRFAEVDGQLLRDKWSTPMREWGELEGLQVPIAGDGVHNYDGEPFVYVGLDKIANLQWNVQELPQRR